MFCIQLLKRYIANGLLDKANIFGNQLLNEFRDNATILNSLAKICTLKKQYSSAKKYANRAYQLDPDNLSIWMTYFNLYIQLGNKQNIIYWLDKIQEKQPDYIESDQLGEILDSLKD